MKTAGAALVALQFTLFSISAFPEARSEPKTFRPPLESALKNDKFGKMVLRGKDIFIHTKELLPENVGSNLSCSSCHLDRGRLENASPLWAAFTMYPAYREKTKKVDTFTDRLAGCFKYSMNGKAPALDSEAMTALTTYAYWLSKGAPVNTELKGRGFIKVSAHVNSLTEKNGAAVYRAKCALCHGESGEGQLSGGKSVFPPLWGSQSFNAGAGMNDPATMAGFVKANMPLGLGGSLSDEEALEVAVFVTSKPRPANPK